MQSLDLIKKRISIVRDVQKITSSMKLVAAAKSRKLINNFASTKSFYNDFYSIIFSLVSSIPQSTFKRRAENNKSSKALWVVICSSLGLCGGFNANITRDVVNNIGNNDDIILIGNKGEALLKAKGLKERIIQVIDISDRESQYLEIIPLCTLISQKFAAGEYKTVNIEYTRYINSLKSVPTHKKILPIDKDVFVDSSVEVKYKDTILSEEGKVIQFEPGPLSILDNSTIVFLSTVIQAAVAESKVSENTTRMNNMQAATDNANDLIATLTLKYNKLRQEQITQEINEIVQGAGSE